MGLWDKLNANHYIAVYGLQDNSQPFFTVQDYMKRRDAADHYSLLVINLILALFILIDAGLFWMGLRKVAA